MKRIILLALVFISLLLLCTISFGQGEWTEVENLPGVTTDIYFNSEGERYVTKKNGVLLFGNDTLAEYGVIDFSELGLLAVAEYNDQVCVYFTGLDFQQHLVCGNDTIVSIPYDQEFHVGGDIVVEDSILYLSTGYGSNPNDAQDISNLRGKLLAWDGDSLWIHSIGFRNPWRFDIVEDTVYVADVGWNTWEELNVFYRLEPFNGGWPCVEGLLVHNDTCGFVNYPMHGYIHPIPPNEGSRSITGIGYFGTHYFYTDFYTGLGFRWRKNDVHFMQTPVDIVSGAVDSLNNQLYIISFDGKIYLHTPIVLGIVEADPKPKEGKRDYHDWWIAELIEEYGGDVVFDIYGRKFKSLPTYPGIYFSPTTGKVKVVVE